MILMGDTGEVFKAFNEYKREQRAREEPSRLKYAIDQLNKLSISYIRAEDVIFICAINGQIDFWPFTGWFCGRKPLGNIKGRGIKNLLKILSERNSFSL